MNRSEIKTKLNYHDYNISEYNNPVKSNPTIKLLLNYLTNEDQKKIVKNILDQTQNINHTHEQNTMFNRLSMYKDKKKVKSVVKTKHQSIVHYTSLSQKKRPIEKSMSPPQFPPIKKNQEKKEIKPNKQIKKEKMPQKNLKQKIVTQKSIQSPQEVKQKKRKFPTQFNFYLGPGNNHEVIRRVMQDRKTHWTEVPISSQIIHFKWQQTQQGYNYEKLICDGLYLKEIVNLFENHKEVTSKIGLVKSLIRYFDYNLDTTFSILPMAFILNFQTKTWKDDIDTFVDFYVANSPNKLDKTNLNLNFYKQKQFSTPYKNYNVTYDQSIVNEKIKNIKLQKVFVGSKNYLWLLKPTDWNRGDGVHVFSNLKELEDLLTKYYSGWYADTYDQGPSVQQQNTITDNESTIEKDNETERQQKGLYFKCRQFVVQKYLEHPFLIDQRKFDIRVWVLLTHKMQFFFFKEGYLRTSSEKFNLDDVQHIFNILLKNNPFIHLTNNAIQKFSKNYGSFENGNQLSFEGFQKYLDSIESGFDFSKQILPKMKEIIISTMYSVKRQINRNNRKYCFQLFGYDFIIDNKFDPWLIEVNTNPCLEESSSLLKMIIPRMINDLLKLTIDDLFMKFNFPEVTNLEDNDEIINYDKYIKSQGNGTYPMKDCCNNQNLWEYLGCF